MISISASRRERLLPPLGDLSLEDLSLEDEDLPFGGEGTEPLPAGLGPLGAGAGAEPLPLLSDFGEGLGPEEMSKQNVQSADGC